MSLLAVLGVIAAGLSNLQKIQDYFAKPASPLTVPPIVVEVENSSNQPVEIAQRSDFFLWFPGPNGYHAIGKYEFRHLDRSAFEGGVETLPPKSKKRFLAHIMDQPTYARVLERADCDVAFMVRKAAGGLRTTSNLPFTKDAINRYCATVDIGADYLT